MHFGRLARNVEVEVVIITYMMAMVIEITNMISATLAASFLVFLHSLYAYCTSTL